jgi:PIN domain nuclease of toxin-antitoxin system
MKLLEDVIQLFSDEEVHQAIGNDANELVLIAIRVNEICIKNERNKLIQIRDNLFDLANTLHDMRIDSIHLDTQIELINEYLEANDVGKENYSTQNHHR